MLYYKQGGAARTGINPLCTLPPPELIPAEGSCGSPIWDEDGKLVCFFRYLVKSGPRAGFGFGISAMELKNYGVELCDGRRET